LRAPRLNSVVVVLAVLSAVLCWQASTRAEAGAGGRTNTRLYPNAISGPYLVNQQEPLASPIASMKRLPDGAPVCVHRKCVTGIWFDHMFVEEVDRSAGIKVIFGDDVPSDLLRRGNLVSFHGVMGTVGGQRVVFENSSILCDFQSFAPIGSLGMSSAGIMGWPINPKFPNAERYLGLSATGLYVRISGVVTSANWADEDGYFIYLDDGWGKKDKSEADAPGVRVYTNVIPNVGDFLVASGVLSTKVAYDPTPQGPSGDELIIPVIRTTFDMEPSPPATEPTVQPSGPVSGRVRLVGEPPPGRQVRIYSEHDVVVIDGVTDEYKPFTLSRVPVRGDSGRGYVGASASGYVSDTICAIPGGASIDFDLQPSDTLIEIESDRASIATCSTETALISALLRDCEGKGLAGRQIRLTTSRGSFLDFGGSREIVLTTDASGVARARLSASPDGAGVASVRASAYPGAECANRVDIILRGPSVSASANPRYLVGSGTSLITTQVTVDGVAVPGANVTFKTDHGVFVESGSSTFTATSDDRGYAHANLSVTSPGTARVVAVYTNECGHQVANWAVVSYKSAPWYSQGVQYSNPLIANLYDRPDGKKQAVLVTSAGSLSVLDSNAAVLWSKILHLPGNNSPSCAPMDAERSGRPCVFIPAESQQRVYAFAYDGRTLAGWPTGSNYRFIKVAASIADANLDGSPEIVAGDECCYVFCWNPTGDWKKTGTAESSFLWRNLTGSSSTTIYGTTTAIGDLDNDADHIPDVVLGSNHSTALFAFPGDAWGDFISHPLYLTGFPKAAGARVETSPAVGDLDGDGLNDIAVGSSDGKLYIGLASENHLMRGYDTGGPVKSSPALYDLDGDGKLDVIIGSDSGRLCAFNWLGQAPEGWGQGIKLSSATDYQIESSPVVGDVTGDGVPEIVVGCNDGNVYAVYKDGMNHSENGSLTSPIAWVRCCVPISKASAKVLATPVIDDIDGDGKVEVMAAGDEGVYLFHFEAPYDPQNLSSFPWPTFHRDNQRVGCVTPLPPLVNASIQGIVTKNGVPLTNTKVYIYYQDGSTVPEPKIIPEVARSWVQTTGTSDLTEAGRGAYCISQLPANSTYKLKVEAPGQPEFWVENIAVTTGMVRVDIALP
jgi:hypothetical protein